MQERISKAVRGLLRWWLRELAGLVPRQLFGSGVALPVRLNGEQLRFDASPPVALDIGALPAPLRDRIAAADTIVLVLPAAMVLRRTIDIPAAAAREIGAAVPFLVERHTPFPPGQARAAWRIASATIPSGNRGLDLAVTAAAPLDRILATLHRLGVPVGAIHLDGDETLPRLDFAAAGASPVRSWLAEPWRPLLAGTITLLLAGPIVVAGVIHMRARSMEQGIVAGGEPERLRAQIQDDARLAAILAARAAEPDALDMLQGVTQALPDSAWLFSLDMTPQTLQLGGFSTDMPAAVGRLQALPAVAKLEFRSPVIHDAHADRDRFDILLRFNKAGNVP